MKEINYLFQAVFICALLLLTACNDGKPEKKVATEANKDSASKTEAVAEAKKEPAVEAKRAPVINIADTLSVKQIVLTMKDSAATFERVSLKLAGIYGSKLGPVLKKNNIKMMGAPMAWYKGEKAPYFFEAGVPVDKKPAKLPSGVFAKEMGIDSIVVAHFYGPYDMIPLAYDALRDWLKDHKKTAKGAPYEIYIGDPIDADGKPKDPYKIQTDIVFPWK